jgi:probable HAF family extracellular repeat protein
VVGGYGFGSSQGFEQSGAKFRNVTPPGIQGTVSATAINNLGQIVGWSYDINIAGFFFQNGKYRTINVPNSENSTNAWGINYSGMIVGSYFGCTPSCNDHGFVFFKGKYVSFDFPGSSGTFAYGINSSGQIVGTYNDSQNFYYHGFVTSPINVEEIR